MIVSIKRDSGEFIEVRESESKDFNVLADFFARCTLSIWQAELKKTQSGTGSALKSDEEVF